MLFSYLIQFHGLQNELTENQSLSIDENLNTDLLDDMRDDSVAGTAQDDIPQQGYTLSSTLHIANDDIVEKILQQPSERFTSNLIQDKRDPIKIDFLENNNRPHRDARI